MDSNINNSSSSSNGDGISSNNNIENNDSNNIGHGIEIKTSLDINISKEVIDGENITTIVSENLEREITIDNDDDLANKINNINISGNSINNNSSSTSPNNNNLSKKEMLGILLVDSFSNFYIQNSILNDINNGNSLVSPATVIGDGYKDTEVTSFLINAFLYLSIPMKVLNYLLLTNKTPLNQQTIYQNSSTSLSKVSSFNSLASLPQSPILNSSTSATALTTATSIESELSSDKDNNQLLPVKTDRKLISELEMFYDNHYNIEVFEFSQKMSTLDLETKSKLYFDYLSDLSKRAVNILPKSYKEKLSNNFNLIVRESIEFFLIQNLFHYLFPIDFERDLQFTKRIESLKFLELSHLGIQNGDERQFTKSLCTTLLKINIYQTPLDKQRCLSRVLIKLLKLNGGEETLLPNLIYLILKSNPPNIWSNYKFLEYFKDNLTNQQQQQQQQQQNSIYEYSYLLFSTAILFIEKLDYNHLQIDSLYFQTKLLEYQQVNNSTLNQSQQQDNNNSNNSQEQFINSTNISIKTFSNLLINDSSNNSSNDLSNIYNINNNNNNNNGNNNSNNNEVEYDEDEIKFKLFKENNRIQNIIEICKNQINENEIEEILLKFISISLIKEKPSYHSLIRYSLKRFFIYYLGVKPRLFLSTEMHTIGALQDDHSSSELEVLPQQDGSNSGALSNTTTTTKDKAIKTGKIVGAAVTGAVLVGLTGGLAAPFIGTVLNFVGAGSIVAGISGATGLSSATMLSVIFGAAGAKVTADKMISATSGIKDYSIHKIKSQTSLHAIIGIFGLCNDVTQEYYQTKSIWDRVIRSVTDDYGDIFLIEWEKEVILKLKGIVSEYQGTIVQGIVRSAATNIISQSLASALVPLSVLKAASVLDNPWTLLKDRSEKAGKLLAQQIVDGYFGNRPLTLISTSMGSRMVFYCLEELYQQSHNNPNIFSLIETVVFIGSPITSDPSRWSKILKLISGRVINCYTSNDLLLKYVCRSINCLSDGILPAAGVAPIHIPSSNLVIENVDLSNIIKSHLDYEKEEILSKILQHIDINNIKYCKPKISPLYSGSVIHL